MAAGTADENEPLLATNLIRNDSSSSTCRYIAVDKNDPEDPVNYSRSFKWSAVALMAAMAFAVTFNCISVVPVANHIVIDLTGKPSKSASILLVTVWELGEAAGPLLIGPLSELFGRYPVINVANCFFIAATVLAATSPTVTTFIAARALTGMAVTVNVLNPAIVGDIFRPEQRGSPMSMIQLAPLIGGAVGPAISGAIAQTVGWRQVLWMGVVLAVACELLFLTFFRETYKMAIVKKKAKRLRRGSIANRALLDVTVGEVDAKATGKFWDSIVRPMAVYRSSIVLVAMSLYGGVGFAHFYVMSVTLPGILEDIYGLSPALTGASMIAFSLGSTAGVMVCNATLDKVYIKLRAANNGIEKPEYRLPLVIIGGLTMPLAIASYGWITELRLPVPVLLTSVALIGVTMMLSALPLSTYVVDAFGDYSASALTAVIIVRCTMGTFLPLTTLPLVSNLGYGWGFTVLAAGTMCLAPVPIAIMRYGEKWRQYSKYSRV